MATRKGNVILLRSLREQMVAHIRREYLDKFSPEWPESEISGTAHAVAVAAIKYGMLARDVNQKIVFDMQAWLQLTGNTGPYLQYTCARANSILTKCAEVDKTLTPPSSPATPTPLAALAEPSERALVLALDRLPAVLHQAADQLRPSILCTYLFDLAQTFNAFNAACPVKPTEGDLLQARLLLVTSVTKAMAHALGVLGIPAPRRM
jgi:arginyl-tRNA synthetase